MLLENPYPPSIGSIEDQVIESSNLEEGETSRQILKPFRSFSLRGDETLSREAEEILKNAILNSVTVQTIVADIKSKPKYKR